MDTLNWIYRGNVVRHIDCEKYAGFVYIITHRKTGKYYIGKKFTRNKIKGRLVEQWRGYTSSSEELNKDIKKYGLKEFERRIIKFCKTKGTTAYYEGHFQFKMKCLLDENSYNKYVHIRVNRNSIKP